MLKNYPSLSTFLQVRKNKYFDLMQFSDDVTDIIRNVVLNKDQALLDYTLKYDQCRLKALRVSDEEINQAMNKIPKSLLEALIAAQKNIEAYHNLQKPEEHIIQDEGISLRERNQPLESVGIYVPGGKAAYPSTVLMNAIPGKIAGVKRIVMVTPPQADGTIKASVLAAAKLVGVDEIYKVGGAQAIAALAYGTESIKPVKKIVGPGNAYVALAKKMVSDFVGIDMIAGPSEILVLADETANPSFIAADLIAQAEHDENATALLATSSEKISKEVSLWIEKLLKDHPREGIVRKSIQLNGGAIMVKNESEMIELANNIAPEHLEIMTREPSQLASEVESAGAIFLGAYSPEALGDYFAGPNHTLPTSGTAKFSSPLGVLDYMKKTSIIAYSKERLIEASRYIIDIANDEGLFGHAEAIKIRRP